MYSDMNKLPENFCIPGTRTTECNQDFAPKKKLHILL